MDRIKFEILDDGTLSIQTDAISKQNHMSADELLDGLTDVLGGDRTVTPRRAIQHHHLHTHSHETHLH